MAVITRPARSHALPWWRSKSGQRRLQRVLATALIWLLLAVVMTPFFWMLSTALKEEGQIWLQPPQWIPQPLRWDNFYQAVTQIPFLTFFTTATESGTLEFRWTGDNGFSVTESASITVE